MSGGSFNYLCNWDPYPMGHDALEPMAEELQEIGATTAAIETRMLIAKFAQLQQDLDSMITAELRNVWHAVEWWRSNDWGEDQMRTVIDKFEGRRTS